MSEILCIFFSHKWRHIADIVIGYENSCPLTRGFWQCHRCKEISIGKCDNGPKEEEGK